MSVPKRKFGFAIFVFTFLLLVESFDFSFAQSSGSIITVAGTGAAGFSGDGGPAPFAQINNPEGIAVDSVGNLYIADTGNDRIRRVTPNGIISTIAGGGFYNPGDGRPATSVQLASPADVALDSAGNLYIADFNNGRIRKVTPAGTITTVAGGGSNNPGDGGPATSAAVVFPTSIAVDEAGNIYFNEARWWIDESDRVRKVTPKGVISTVAGGGSYNPGDGGPATSVWFDYVAAIAVDPAGNLFIADQLHHRIFKVTTDGVITTVAGDGTEGYSGDGGPATSAQLSGPFSIAVDFQGNIYFAEDGNKCIRKVSEDGIISTVLANLSGIMDIGLAGNLYIGNNNRVLKARDDSATNTTLYFPEVIAGGGWSTLFTFTNTGLAETSGILVFRNPQGNPLEVNAALTDSTGSTLPAKAASSFAITIRPGGTIFLETISSDSQDEMQTAWAQLEATGGQLSGMATYEFDYNAYAELFFSAPSSPLIQFASVPFHNDDAIGKETAYAIANPGSTPLLVNLSLVDQAGRVANDSVVLEIGPGQQIAKYLWQDLDCYKFRGSVNFYSENGQPFVLSTLVEKQGLFTALPAAAAE